MRKKIPFVDDEAEMRSLVGASLQRVGYGLLTGADASEIRKQAEAI